jgi:hypothetical protein
MLTIPRASWPGRFELARDVYNEGRRRSLRRCASATQSRRWFKTHRRHTRALRSIARRLPVTRWLREAEDAAGIEHVARQGFHSLRRAWATARKHLPDVDVAAAGGWKSLEALKQSYQQADSATMLRVVSAASLRKATP